MKKEVSTGTAIGIFVAVLAIIVIIGFFKSRAPSENRNATLGVMRETVIYRQNKTGSAPKPKPPRAPMPPGR